MKPTINVAGGDTVAGLIYNGITYTLSQTRFDATRELLQKLVDGKANGVAMSLSHNGAWHHLFITPGAAIALIE